MFFKIFQVSVKLERHLMAHILELLIRGLFTLSFNILKITILVTMAELGKLLTPILDTWLQMKIWNMDSHLMDIHHILDILGPLLGILELWRLLIVLLWLVQVNSLFAQKSSGKGHLSNSDYIIPKKYKLRQRTKGFFLQGPSFKDICVVL